MATSQNGWPVVTNSAILTPLPWITGRVRPGDVAVILDHLCRRFHNEVEKITKGHSWGWAYRPIRGASGGYSNHASGTAIDLNAPAHPLGKRGTFSARKRRKIEAILRDLDGVVRWGGHYSGRPDEMHFEINATPAAVRRVALRLKATKATKGRRVRTIASWNVHVAQDAAGVRKGLEAIIARHDPDVIALQEVYGDVAVLRALGQRRGYRVLIGKRAKPYRSVAGQESQSSALLVHERIPMRSWWPIRLKRAWIGPKHGLRRPGRTFVSAIVGGLVVSVVHMPTNRRSAKNKPAWRESIARLVGQARTQGRRRPIVQLGDWNDRHTSNDGDSVRAYAKRIGATVVHGAAPIDYAVVRGIRAKVQTGDRLGSDHRYFILALDWSK